MKHRRITLSPEEKSRLTTLYHNSLLYRVRERAQALLLSNRGFSRNEIAALLDKQLDTISAWFNRFEEDREWDLEDLEGRGRKSSLPEADKKKSQPM